MEFRKDINGLRAIAVTAVVLFHFNANWLPGGFAGVDVFFVISGFLMTGIIFRGLENNNFSIMKFYLARAKRIIPALAILCIALWIFGWFYLIPLEYKTLNKHIASSLGFLSNVIYWKESGYFAAASHEKWLLHTWSLSVEWQFYIIYPIILVMMKRFVQINTLRYLILIGSVLGFACCIFATNKWPTSSFYLLPTRAWEMLLGGVAYLYPLNLGERRKKALELLGIALILISYIFLTGKDLWPGYLSFLPVFGAFLIIQSSKNKSLLTGNSIFQKIGTYSYSIYLWHWPIVVFLNYFGNNDIQEIILGIATSFLLGIMSYHIVEKRLVFQVNKITFSSVIFYKPILMTVAMGLISTTTYLLDGIRTSYRQVSVSERENYLDTYQRSNYIDANLRNEYRFQCDFFDAVSYTAKVDGIDAMCTKKHGDGGLFLWGDSHAQALSFGLRNSISKNVPFYQVASSGCRPNLNEDQERKGELKKACDRSNAQAIKSIQELHPNIVVFAQADNHHENDFKAIALKLKSLGVSKVYLVGPVPQWDPSLPLTITKRHWSSDETRFNDSSFKNHLFDINNTLEKEYANTDYLEYISIINEVCNVDGCIAKVDNNNTPLVWDYGHLSLEGSKFIVENVVLPKINEYLDKSSIQKHFKIEQIEKIK